MRRGRGPAAETFGRAVITRAELERGFVNLTPGTGRLDEWQETHCSYCSTVLRLDGGCARWYGDGHDLPYAERRSQFIKTPLYATWRYAPCRWYCRWNWACRLAGHLRAEVMP